MLEPTKIVKEALIKRTHGSSPAGQSGTPSTSQAAQRASGASASTPGSASESRPQAGPRRAASDPPTPSTEKVGALMKGLESWGTDEATLSEQAEREQAAENQALEDLDQYGDLFDNPGGGRRDGIISTNDLKAFSEGNFNRDAAREQLLDLGVAEADLDTTLDRLTESASYLLKNEDVLDRLDVANDQRGGTDGRISRGDISREVFQRQLEQARNGELPPGPPASNRGSYEPTVTTKNSERSPEVIAQQELAILEAVNSGEPVSFTNANGQTEELTVRQVHNTGGNAVYEITGADGHTMRIESELGASENRTALARLADYYTQLPENLRDTVDKIEFRREPDDSAAARFYSSGDRIVFYDGLKHLNEEVFDHEFAHGIGYENDGLGEGVLDHIGRFFTGSEGEGTPEGWTDAIEADADERISDYANTNIKEDFAECWAAYMEAVDNGPEALAKLEEAYPARYAIMEELYNRE
jgi:hypothetical protein